MVTYIKNKRYPYFPRLIINDYKYLKHRNGEKVSYWKCCFYDKGYCKARCAIHVDQTISLTGDHTCQPTAINEEATIISQEYYQIRPK